MSQASPHALGAKILARAGWLVWVYILAVCVGLAVYGGDSSDVDAHPRREDAPRFRALTNLAQLSAGGRVRASSYFVFAHHHPIFAIDGREWPLPVEMWSSHPDDDAPWIEVELAHRANVSAVRLELTGARDGGRSTMRAFTIRCLRDGESVFEHSTFENGQVKVQVPVSCPQTDRVRAAFMVEPESPYRNVARLVELEVLGSHD